MGDTSALTAAERAILEALNASGIRYLIVGVSAANLQGANLSTQDIDIWFEDVNDPRVGDAVRAAGGVWVSGSFGMTPPMIGGDLVGDRFDVVTHMHGMRHFSEEYRDGVDVVVDDVPLKVLPIERILESKRAAGRNRDLAAIPALQEALVAIRDGKGG